MIVKIQRSQLPTPPGLVLVYNSTKSVIWQGEIDQKVDEWMERAQKMFAHAHIEGTEIVIDRPAPWKNW